MVKRSPVRNARSERWVSRRANSGSAAATDWALTAASRAPGSVRIHCRKAPPPARFSVVCCQSIQRSASKRTASPFGWSVPLAWRAHR
jgi:hypothetical protein